MNALDVAEAVWLVRHSSNYSDCRMGGGLCLQHCRWK
jgi:hypothetical protein